MCIDWVRIVFSRWARALASAIALTATAAQLSAQCPPVGLRLTLPQGTIVGRLRSSDLDSVTLVTALHGAWAFEGQPGVRLGADMQGDSIVVVVARHAMTDWAIGRPGPLQWRRQALWGAGSVMAVTAGLQTVLSPRQGPALLPVAGAGLLGALWGSAASTRPWHWTAAGASPPPAHVVRAWCPARGTPTGVAAPSGDLP